MLSLCYGGGCIHLANLEMAVILICNMEVTHDHESGRPVKSLGSSEAPVKKIGNLANCSLLQLCHQQTKKSFDFAHYASRKTTTVVFQLDGLSQTNGRIHNNCACNSVK